MLWDSSDTPVEYRGAQKRLNRTGNLGSVLEDWKRLQGLGLTNKYLESRSLSDFNIYMYTTPIGDVRLLKKVHYQTKNLDNTTARRQFAQN